MRGSTYCVSRPSTIRRAVRRASWRRTSRAKARRRSVSVTSACTTNSSTMRYADASGAIRLANHTRSCAGDAGTVRGAAP
ncbi:hypothetical protein SANTM175S_08445 [Streptomyces antimycoticus]